MYQKTGTPKKFRTDAAEIALSMKIPFINSLEHAINKLQKTHYHVSQGLKCTSAKIPGTIKVEQNPRLQTNTNKRYLHFVSHNS